MRSGPGGQGRAERSRATGQGMAMQLAGSSWWAQQVPLWFRGLEEAQCQLRRRERAEQARRGRVL